MSIYKKINNTLIPINLYKYIDNANDIQPYEVKNIYKKTDDRLLPVFNYEWKNSEWDECSEPCGGGIQHRTTTCTRDDNVPKNDIFCNSIPKPPLEQECNTTACAEYRTIHYSYDDGIGIYHQDLKQTILSTRTGYHTWKYWTGASVLLIPGAINNLTVTLWNMNNADTCGAVIVDILTNRNAIGKSIISGATSLWMGSHHKTSLGAGRWILTDNRAGWKEVYATLDLR